METPGTFLEELLSVQLLHGPQFYVNNSCQARHYSVKTKKPFNKQEWGLTEVSCQNKEPGRLLRIKMPKLRSKNLITLKELFVVTTQISVYFYFLSPILLS